MNNTISISDVTVKELYKKVKDMRKTSGKRLIVTDENNKVLSILVSHKQAFGDDTFLLNHQTPEKRISRIHEDDAVISLANVAALKQKARQTLVGSPMHEMANAILTSAPIYPTLFKATRTNILPMKLQKKIFKLATMPFNSTTIESGRFTIVAGKNQSNHKQTDEFTIEVFDYSDQPCFYLQFVRSTGDIVMKRKAKGFKDSGAQEALEKFLSSYQVY